MMLVSVATALASVAGAVSLVVVIRTKVHFEFLYQSKMKALGFDESWIKEASLTHINRIYKRESFDAWLAELIWSWFWEGLEQNLIGDALDEYILNKYEMFELDSED